MLLVACHIEESACGRREIDDHIVEAIARTTDARNDGATLHPSGQFFIRQGVDTKFFRHLAAQIEHALLVTLDILLRGGHQDVDFEFLTLFLHVLNDWREEILGISRHERMRENVPFKLHQFLRLMNQLVVLVDGIHETQDSHYRTSEHKRNEAFHSRTLYLGIALIAIVDDREVHLEQEGDDLEQAVVVDLTAFRERGIIDGEMSIHHWRVFDAGRNTILRHVIDEKGDDEVVVIVVGSKEIGHLLFYVFRLRRIYAAYQH